MLESADKYFQNAVINVSEVKNRFNKRKSNVRKETFQRLTKASFLTKHNWKIHVH